MNLDLETMHCDRGASKDNCIERLFAKSRLVFWRRVAIVSRVLDMNEQFN